VIRTVTFRPLQILLLVASGMLCLLSGCRSKHIDIDVENRTGAPIRLLEVDYPNASFGSDGMASGAILHYRIQVTGDGPLTLQYTAGNGHSVQNNGPSFAAGAQGKLDILLLPAGKAEFHPAN
jgi:hypothetical protein